MTTPKPTTVFSPTKRADARLQVFVGFGVICLASLMFQATMTNVISSKNDPSSMAENVGALNNSPIPSGAGLSNAQLQTILSSIAELSDLVQESTASLHQNLDGITCTFGRKKQEPNGAEVAASLIGTFVAFLWLLGLVILTDGLYKISTTLRNRVWGGGLLGANVGLGCLLVMPPPENWFSYFSWTLWPMYLGMLGGLFSDRETFLAEEGKAAVKN